MGRAPCCDKANVKKGPWSPEEDDKLKSYIQKHGTAGNWIALPQKLGLRRCGKSCRLRWLNYLRPNIKHGEFSDDEDRIICSLFASIGSRWSIMAAQLPGRTDNDIKNYWNTKLKKKLMGINNNNIINYNIAPTLSTNYQNAPHQLINSPPPFHHLPEPYAVPADFSGSIGPGPTRFDSLIAFGGGAGDHHQDLLCNYFGGGVDEINDQKFSFGAAAASSTAEIEDPLEYSIEEIKQLIGTSNVCGGLMSFFADETVVKAEGI